MRIVDSIQELRVVRGGLVGSIGLVPTMGALHQGHLALVERARRENDQVLVTIFVNPTQFGANEDLAKYPRDLPSDLRMLEAAQTDLVFTPTPALMYPQGFQTWVEVVEVTQGLEGEYRPGHFKGVATVVAKLFNLTQPDRAYFGQKDAQQVAVIKRMVKDLDFPLEVVVCPTIREPDGLAMSSRNVFLTADERQAAGVLYRALQTARLLYEREIRDAEILKQAMMDEIRQESLAQIEYVSVADAQSLREVDKQIDDVILLSMAVRFGKTRLIDNLMLPVG
ncbi:MAG: pantoate--beta-alanine ligase [Anaerolineae bacterium]|nr:pantoate--beta-alanine ligase [Anaerolineae bacterium]